MLDLDPLERDFRAWQKAMDEGRVLSGDYVLARLTPALLDAFVPLIAELRASRKVVRAADEVVEDWRGRSGTYGGSQVASLLRLIEAIHELRTINAISDTEPPSRRAGAFDVKQEYR